jgi:hypothetical protein
MSLFRRRAPAPPPAGQVTRVYTREGRKAHLRVDGVVLCPTDPGPSGWKGATIPEAAWAGSLPLCTYCRDALAEAGGGTP